MPKWVEVAMESDLPPGSKVCVESPAGPGSAGMPLVVGNVKGTLFACANICPHAGLPIGDGDLRGATLTCPYHGYTFNVQTGKNIDDPSDGELPRFPVRVVEGRVEVELPGA
jgi:nitrite reductase/ring-hydroxylating ferredoxin subunit